jgi:hypothetical protein
MISLALEISAPSYIVRLNLRKDPGSHMAHSQLDMGTLYPQYMAKILVHDGLNTIHGPPAGARRSFLMPAPLPLTKDHSTSSHADTRILRAPLEMGSRILNKH